MNFYYYTFAVRQGKCASAKKKKKLPISARAATKKKKEKLFDWPFAAGWLNVTWCSSRSNAVEELLP